MTKKIISFSLWGKQTIYNYGLLENVIIAKDKFPDWIVRVYFSNRKDCVEKIIDKLYEFDNVEMIEMGNGHGKINMCWRFLPAFEDNVDILLVRDADSRIGTEREMNMIDMWLKSGKKFFIIRDGPTHFRFKILGGMWGCRGGIIKDMKNEYNNFFINNLKGKELFGIKKKKFNEYKKVGYFGYDMFFLIHIVYPRIIDQAFVIISKQVGKRGIYKGEKVVIVETAEVKKFVGAVAFNAPKAFKKLEEEKIILEKEGNRGRLIN